MHFFNYKDWQLLSALPESDSQILFDYINNQELKEPFYLKKHHRSDVIVFHYNNKKLVLKIPKEKNTRKWIRFTTIYRTGEAFKNLQGMQLLQKIGIKTTKPVMAAEKRTFGMVTDSWLVYEYLEGENCLDKTEKYPEVVKLLQELHSKGYLHNDAQIRNFILHGNQLCIIDSNPSRASLGAISKAEEFAYLAKSAPGIEAHFGELRNSWIYVIAARKDRFKTQFSRFRRRIKKAIGIIN